MSRPALVGDADDLVAELQALPALKYEDLRQRFLTLYDTQPPPRLGRALLLRAIAYRLQKIALGGLSPSLRRLLLTRVARESTDGTAGARAASRKATPGTLLIPNSAASLIKSACLRRGCCTAASAIARSGRLPA
jgi:hypothetical protein